MASWWDYGYQTTAMANRTVIVDNNTWNNTHIATVGRAMSSPERKAWQIYRSLDVDYVLVVFGGFIGCAASAVWLHTQQALRPGCLPHAACPSVLIQGGTDIEHPGASSPPRVSLAMSMSCRLLLLADTAA